MTIPETCTRSRTFPSPAGLSSAKTPLRMAQTLGNFLRLLVRSLASFRLEPNRRASRTSCGMASAVLRRHWMTFEFRMNLGVNLGHRKGGLGPLCQISRRSSPVTFRPLRHPARKSIRIRIDDRGGWRVDSGSTRIVQLCQLGRTFRETKHDITGRKESSIRRRLEPETSASGSLATRAR